MTLSWRRPKASWLILSHLPCCKTPHSGSYNIQCPVQPDVDVGVRNCRTSFVNWKNMPFGLFSSPAIISRAQRQDETSSNIAQRIFEDGSCNRSSIFWSGELNKRCARTLNGTPTSAFCSYKNVKSTSVYFHSHLLFIHPNVTWFVEMCSEPQAHENVSGVSFFIFSKQSKHIWWRHSERKKEQRQH